MLRLSVKATVNVPPLTWTSRTRSWALGAKMPKPSLLERGPPLAHIPQKLGEFLGREPDVTGKHYRPAARNLRCRHASTCTYGGPFTSWP